MSEPQKKTLTERAVDWAFQQGVSTILLLLIFSYAYTNIPKHIEAINNGYEKIAAKFEKEQEKTRDIYEKSIDVMREEHKLDRMQSDRLSSIP